tara:strand:- start:866 stop:1240 length:375 start_codon:yes stop_codon:yes gene_type:complete
MPRKFFRKLDFSSHLGRDVSDVRLSVNVGLHCSSRWDDGYFLSFEVGSFAVWTLAGVHFAVDTDKFWDVSLSRQRDSAMTSPFRQAGPAAARQLNTHDRSIHCGSLSKIDIRRFDYCFAGIRVC